MAPRRLSSLLVALTLLGGCASVPPPRPVDTEARHALDLLEARLHDFRDLRTLGDVAIQRAGEPTRHLTGVLLVKSPDSVRFEVLSPFGPPLPVLVVTIHEGTLTAYDTEKNEALIGPATAETIERVLGLPLDAEDLVAVLAGCAATPKDLRVAEILPPDAAGPSLNLIGGVQRQRVWMDLGTGEVSRVEIGGGRVPVMIIYRRDGDTPLGFDFNAREYVTGSVTYRDVVLGAGIDSERFTLALPKAAKIRTIR